MSTPVILFMTDNLPISPTAVAIGSRVIIFFPLKLTIYVSIRIDSRAPSIGRIDERPELQTPPTLPRSYPMHRSRPITAPFVLACIRTSVQSENMHPVLLESGIERSIERSIKSMLSNLNTTNGIWCQRSTGICETFNL